VGGVTTIHPPTHEDVMKIAGLERSAETFELLEAVHALMLTLRSDLDVQDTLRPISVIAARIIPHDEANLLRTTDGGSSFQLHATTSDRLTVGSGFNLPGTTVELSKPMVLDEVPGPERGLRSGLTVPIRISDDVSEILALFSSRPNAFSPRDLIGARRLADYLARSHQCFVGQAGESAAADVENSLELLRAISNVLDIRTVFSRVSEIANKMLAHDAMIMTFVDSQGNIVYQAASPEDLPPLGPAKLTTSRRDEVIIGDLLAEPLPVSTQANRDQLVRAGQRSMLGIFAQARDQVMSVAFFSKLPQAFNRSHVLVARRIVDHIALALSHEQLAEAARQVAEARVRAERLEARVQSLSEELASTTHRRVIGESTQWRDALKKATQVAETDTTVLLTGESGTGKEVIARFIHRGSPRSKGPFVALNCAALPEQLLESELFGYERGAFTSAHQAKPGHIELASGGVLFLDEIGEMSVAAQAKFLRVLQEQEYQRLGGTRFLKANIRVVAATNRDLQAAIARGTFREDLFYRLQVFDIHIAPLRERREDILPLSEAFLTEIGKSFGKPPAGLTRDARDALVAYDWPGNVRELRNALERAAILCEGGLIGAEHLTLQRASRPSQQSTTDVNTVEREMIARVLHETRWNKAKSAKRLGLSRTQLYYRIRKYRLGE
jgi:transcriptional regulator with PAS, ATPase and Fis domain